LSHNCIHFIFFKTMQVIKLIGILLPKDHDAAQMVHVSCDTLGLLN
jgi:hypothetical protein